jgi:hypothetical protein
VDGGSDRVACTRLSPVVLPGPENWKELIAWGTFSGERRLTIASGGQTGVDRGALDAATSSETQWITRMVSNSTEAVWAYQRPRISRGAQRQS